MYYWSWDLEPSSRVGRGERGKAGIGGKRSRGVMDAYSKVVSSCMGSTREESSEKVSCGI
jgi:hypothetical protein